MQTGGQGMADGTGYSLTLADVHNAIIVPPPPRSRTQRVLTLAVLDAAGHILPAGNCATLRRARTGFVPAADQLENPEVLQGTWLYGGLASHHFGHQITRSLGRLQGLATAKGIDGIVFAPLDRRARMPDQQQMMSRLFAGLGIKTPVHHITTTTKIERLLLGPDLFSEQNMCVADPAYVAWAQKSIRPKTKLIPGSKLFVTRTQLDPSFGRLLCEDILEQNLARNGYQIYVPEIHSLPDQLNTYASAETIVTTDGSHGHVMAFARQSGQRIITIARRSEVPATLINHLESFGSGLSNASHHYLTCLMHEWWPPTRVGNVSLGEGDFAALFDQLAHCGALPASAKAGWHIPDQTQIAASKALGRQVADTLLTTAERDALMLAQRQSRKMQRAAASQPSTDTEAMPPMDTSVTDRSTAPQAAAAPATLRADGMRYFRILKGLHQRLKPDWYLEIGTFTGSSLRLAGGNFVAIDPKFQLQHEAPLKGREMIFFQDTSDAFFASPTAANLTGKINLAFLDGLHHYEALLRDFINVEPLMAPGGMVVLHDCLPYNVPMADRTQPPKTDWAGDVWKTLLILMAERPDLRIDILDAAPTGLVVIRNLGAKPKHLKSRYKSLIKTWDPVTFESYPGGLPAFWEKLTITPAGPFLDTLPQT